MPLFGPAASSGSVTSVGLTTPGLLDTVSGSPVTTSGTLALALKTQTANAVLAGPVSGGAANPTVRALVAADVPAVNPSALTGSGTVPLAALSGITTSQISGTAAITGAQLASGAAIAAGQIASVNPSALTGSGTVPLAGLSGITHTQMDAAAGITSGQVASVNPSALTGSGTVPLAALSGITTSQLDAAAGILSAQIAALATSKLTGTIGASQLAVSAPTSGQLGGLTTSNLSATAGILGSQLDAAAAIASGQIASVAASTLTGSIADARLSANVPLLNANNIFTTAGSSASSGTALITQITPTIAQSASAGYTALVVNVTQSSTGSGTKRLLDLQVAGTSKLAVGNSGDVTGQAGFFSTTESHLSSGNFSDPASGKSSGLKISSTGSAGYGLAVGNGVFVLGTSASAVGLTVQGAASQTADLLDCQDSSAHVQFGVYNGGSGGSPVWALKVRATANAESMAVAHTIGAATGKAIQVFDDAGTSLGYIALYS